MLGARSFLQQHNEHPDPHPDRAQPGRALLRALPRPFRPHLILRAVRYRRDVYVGDRGPVVRHHHQSPEVVRTSNPAREVVSGFGCDHPPADPPGPHVQFVLDPAILELPRQYHLGLYVPDDWVAASWVDQGHTVYNRTLLSVYQSGHLHHEFVVRVWGNHHRQKEIPQVLVDICHRSDVCASTGGAGRVSYWHIQREFL